MTDLEQIEADLADKNRLPYGVGDAVVRSLIAEVRKLLAAPSIQPRQWGPWIPWAGGECCPVTEATMFDVKFRSGNKAFGEHYRASCYWVHADGQHDIIAYRVLLPADDLLRQAVEALRQWQSIGQHCTISDGMCCCGDDMERHPLPMNCGHSPTDHGGYQADLALKATATVLSLADERGL